MKPTAYVLLLWLGFCVQSSIAQETAVAGNDEGAIRAVGDAYVAAYNNGDAKALADFWTPEAVYVNRISGDRVVGRDAIAKQFTELFAAEGQEKLEVAIDSIRFVSPNVAVEQGVAKFLSSEAEPGEAEYSAIYVRRDGKWLLDRVTDDPIPVNKSNYEQLQQLEWLIGTWVDADDYVKIVTTCSWTKNQNFITRSFTVSAGDNVEISGLQVIGWDAAENKIRSWTFDSDGGFSRGVWTKTGDDWHVQKNGVTAGGDRTTAVNHLRFIDQDSFALQSTQRTIGAELLPNIDEVIVVRQ